MRRTATLLAAALVGLLLGGLVTLSIQARTIPAAPSRPGAPLPDPVTRPAPAETFLAWTPRGLPDGFAARVRRLPEVGHLTVVAEDNVWLSRTWSVMGELVDRAPRPYLYPVDAAAVDPETFAAFLPPPDRGVLAMVEDGDGILGSTSASLRRLGPGAILELQEGDRVERIRIAAVLPDELMGAAELLVSEQTGRRIGIVRDRYLLMQPADVRRVTSRRLTRLLGRLVPDELGALARVQVRGPGETPYFRAGDAVLPPVLLKILFGEFAARPGDARSGRVAVDPAWVREHIVTLRVPPLGEVTCHRGIVFQLRGAMRDLRASGLGHLIRSFHGCFVPKFINRDPTAMLSHHSWGVAFDTNLAGNYYGRPPHQDPRLVSILERWGFLWGGLFVVPDGNHFEYRRSPLA
jgi:hypothetical protein